jgi:hypothetical protein
MKSKALFAVLVLFAVIFSMSYVIPSRRGASSKPDGADWLYVDHDLATEDDGSHSCRVTGNSQVIHMPD